MVNTLISVYKYFLLLIAFCVSTTASAQEITVDHNRQSASFGTIALSGLSPEVFDAVANLKKKDFGSFFYVRVGDSNYNVLGLYQLKAKSISFKPRFIPDPTIRHLVYFDPDKLSALIKNQVEANHIKEEVTFEVFESSTKVSAFSPDLDTLPDNILRAYVYFNQPMGLENPYDFIKVLDENGNEIDEPFVEVSEGLWNGNRTRLTILFHPGRIKRGVGPSMTKGNIFKPGHHYSLVISDQWQAASGSGLRKTFEKRFFIGQAIRRTVDIQNWQVKVPASQTKTPLMIEPDQPLDRALAERMITIFDINDNSVAGRWMSEGRSWKFIPDKNWKAGSYNINISKKLEDICGNTPESVFDYGDGDERKTSPVVMRAFEIR